MLENFLLKVNLDKVDIFPMVNFIEYLDNRRIFYTYKEPSIIIRPSIIEYSYDSFINYLDEFNSGEVEIYSEDNGVFIPLIKPMEPITIVIDKYSICLKNEIVYVIFDGIITQLKYLIIQTRFRRCIWEYYNETPLVVEKLVNLGYISTKELKSVIDEFAVPF